MPPKGSPFKKKKKRAKKGTKKAKKTLITLSTSDSDESQSLLNPGALGGHLAESNAEDGDGGEGGEASRKRSRPGPMATVTSGAALSDEDEGREEGWEIFRSQVVAGSRLLSVTGPKEEL